MNYSRPSHGTPLPQASKVHLDASNSFGDFVESKGLESASSPVSKSHFKSILLSNLRGNPEVPNWYQKTY